MKRAEMRQPEQAVQAHTGVGPLGMSFAAVAALPREQQDGTLINSSLHTPMDLKAYDCRTWNRCRASDRWG